MIVSQMVIRIGFVVYSTFDHNKGKSTLNIFKVTQFQRSQNWYHKIEDGSFFQDFSVQWLNYNGPMRKDFFLLSRQLEVHIIDI